MRLNERVNERTELEELQRRAYGPEPDLDPAGIARLRELQERARIARTTGLSEPGPAQPPEPSGAAEPEREAPVADLTADIPAAEPVVAATARPWWRRPVALLGAGAVGGMALVGGVMAAVSAADAPAAVLRMTDEERPEGVFGTIADPVLYDMYEGIDVRSSRNEAGRCLYVAYGSAATEIGVFGDVRCAPPGVAPVVELWVGISPLGWSMGEVEGFASGTYLRFELDGDVVKVWRHEPAAPSPMPADG